YTCNTHTALRKVYYTMTRYWWQKLMNKLHRKSISDHRERQVDRKTWRLNN
ncbi:hypothetical protein Bpfe_009962, partial [Biomphalaria pfeifferi]